MSWQDFGIQIIRSIGFGLVGILLFAVAFKIIERSLPFSLHKEIADDQNTALAIIMAAVLLGLGMIVAAAIH